MQTPSLFEARGLTVTYGPIIAVRDVSVEVGIGELVAVAGANGAGKSTLLMTMAGGKRAATGDILLDGNSVLKRSPEERVGLGVSLVPERRRIFRHLTVKENLQVACPRREGLQRGDDHLSLVQSRFPVLARKQAARGGQLSGGEQQQLAIARAWLTRPRFLLLDEPSLGLAPTVWRDVFATLVEMASFGTGILLVEQKALEVSRVACRTYVLSKGRLVATAARGELSSSALHSLYLAVG